MSLSGSHGLIQTHIRQGLDVKTFYGSAHDCTQSHAIAIDGQWPKAVINSRISDYLVTNRTETCLGDVYCKTMQLLQTLVVLPVPKNNTARMSMSDVYPVLHVPAKNFHTCTS